MRRFGMRNKPAYGQYGGLSDDELAKLARKFGVKGVPETMRRETLISKLKELT